jgi:hypothetical protein
LNPQYLKDFDSTWHYEDNKNKRYIPVTGITVVNDVTLIKNKSHVHFEGYMPDGGQVWCLTIDVEVNIPTDKRSYEDNTVFYLRNFEGWSTVSKPDEHFSIMLENIDSSHYLVMYRTASGYDTVKVGNMTLTPGVYHFIGKTYSTTFRPDNGRVWDTGQLTNFIFRGPRMSLPIRGSTHQGGAWFGDENSNIFFVWLNTGWTTGTTDGARMFSIPLNYIFDCFGIANNINWKYHYYAAPYLVLNRFDWSQRVKWDDNYNGWNWNLGLIEMKEDMTFNRLDNIDNKISETNPQRNLWTTTRYNMNVIRENAPSLYDIWNKYSMSSCGENNPRPTQGYMVMCHYLAGNGTPVVGNNNYLNADANSYRDVIIMTNASNINESMQGYMYFNNPYIEWNDDKYLDEIVSVNLLPETVVNNEVLKVRSDGLDFFNSVENRGTLELIVDPNDADTMIYHFHRNTMTSLFLHDLNRVNQENANTKGQVGGLPVLSGQTYSFSFDLKIPLGERVILNIRYHDNYDIGYVDNQKTITGTGDWERYYQTASNIEGKKYLSVLLQESDPITDLYFKNLMINRGKKVYFIESKIKDTGFMNPNLLDVYDSIDPYNSKRSVDLTDSLFDVLRDNTNSFVRTNRNNNYRTEHMVFGNYDFPTEYLTKVKASIEGVIFHYGIGASNNSGYNNYTGIINHDDNVLNGPKHADSLPDTRFGSNDTFLSNVTYLPVRATMNATGTAYDRVEIMHDAAGGDKLNVKYIAMNHHTYSNNAGESVLINNPTDWGYGLTLKTNNLTAPCQIGITFAKLRVLYTEAPLERIDTVIDTSSTSITYISNNRITTNGILEDDNGAPLVDQMIRLYYNDNDIGYGITDITGAFSITSNSFNFDPSIPYITFRYSGTELYNASSAIVNFCNVTTNYTISNDKKLSINGVFTPVLPSTTYDIKITLKDGDHNLTSTDGNFSLNNISIDNTWQNTYIIVDISYHGIPVSTTYTKIELNNFTKLQKLIDQAMTTISKTLDITNTQFQYDPDIDDGHIIIENGEITINGNFSDGNENSLISTLDLSADDPLTAPNLINTGITVESTGVLKTNNVLFHCGVAIYSTGANRLYYSDIIGNVKYTSPGTSYGGGIILNGNLNIDVTYIQECKAGYGGAIYLIKGNLTGQGAQINNNEAYYNGGGIYRPNTGTVSGMINIHDNIPNNKYPNF